VIEELGEGVPVVVHHGSPSTARLYSRWRTDGIRLIGFDRSGYRDASRRRGRSVADVVDEGAAEHGEVALRPMLEQSHAARAAGGVAALRDGLTTLLGPADAETLDGSLADYLYELMAAPGVVDGWIDDDLAFVRPWGFELGSISVPVLIRYGLQDRFVPSAHARWLAEHIPGAEAEITARDGHLTLYEDGIAGVHSWVLRYVH